MGRLSRRALRAMSAAEQEPPVVLPAAPVPAMTVPVVMHPAASGATDCLYAPYPCHLYRAHAPSIWCSSCRVWAVSLYAQNGMRVNASVFNPPVLCAQPCAPVPVVHAAPCPVRCVMPQGASCVPPVAHPTMCPSTCVSFPSMLQN